MEAIAEKVIEGLGSLAIKELEILCNFKDDLDNMKSMVSAIKAVLRDAEAKEMNHQVSDWLEKLKDVLLDADDLLDDFAAEALAREVMTQNKMAKKVRIFFSKSNQVAYALKMGHKIKAIRKRLDEIADVKSKLELRDCHSSNRSVEFRERRQTYSFVGEDEIIGRKKEKKIIVSYLLDTNVTNNVSIVPIVGIGGLGKTALAQLVYNDKVVQDYFELKMWVCVSEEFGIRQIAQKIIGNLTNSELEHVVQDLKMKIEGKHFLLVLDDVWNEDRELWLELKRLLAGGAKGSMIIVTTRSKEVAKIMGTNPPIFLGGLNLKRSWKLFCRVALEEGKEPNNPELVAIGKDIVKRCVGVPLVIRTIGSLLFSRKLEAGEWSYFKDSELSKIDTVEDKVFAMLKLSYDHLPSNLKNCFGYCSLFPKDFMINKETLIQLWAAQGFLQSSDGSKSVEDVGHEYFMKLLSMCLFQDVELYADGEIWTCKMHDLIHDLARSVTKNEYFVLREGKDNNWGDKMRHLSTELKYVWKFPTSVVNREKIRTILSPVKSIEIIPEHIPALLRLYELVGGSAISFPKCLYVLDLNYSFITKIPKSVGKLKHLRYLDLSGNSDIEKLPQDITKLHNLQTLKLNGCESLKELPRDINKMVSLRHLELVICNSLICMPCGLGQLTRLQTLTKFVLDERRRSGSARISELHGLDSLRGQLTIVQLEHQRSNTKEVESAKLLIEKSYLRELELFWEIIEVEENEREQVGYKDEMILEALEPHHTIQGLQIKGFMGKRLSDWIENLTLLSILELSWCNGLASLPESIGNLTSLNEFSLTECFSLTSLPESIGNLKSLNKFSFTGCSSLTSLPKSIGNLTSLKEFRLYGCYYLTLLPESIGNLTSLSEFRLYECSSLTSFPESIGNLISLSEFRIYGCSSLTLLPESIRNLTSLKEFRLGECYYWTSLSESIGNLAFECSSLTSLPELIGNLISLKEFRLLKCSSLTSLPESIGNLTSLKKFRLIECFSLTSLPESIGNFTSLNEFALIECSSLTSLPESIGNLTSLNEFTLNECSSLTSLPESIGNFTSLNKLRLYECASLTSLPKSIGNLTSLKFTLIGCSSLTSLPDSIGNLTSLSEFSLYGCFSLTSLPVSIGNLISLKEFKLFECYSLTSLPESIGNLTSLSEFWLYECSSLTSLLESIGNFTLLKTFALKGCYSLTSLPESIGNFTLLKDFTLIECPMLVSLPEGICNLKSLQVLQIYDCPLLTERYKKERGEDWPKIAHIPNVYVW